MPGAIAQVVAPNDIGVERLLKTVEAKNFTARPVE